MAPVSELAHALWLWGSAIGIAALLLISALFSGS